MSVRKSSFVGGFDAFNSAERVSFDMLVQCLVRLRSTELNERDVY